MAEVKFGTLTPPRASSLGSSPSASPAKSPVAAIASRALVAHERIPSSSLEKKEFKPTTIQGSEDTLKRFDDFVILLERIMGGSSANTFVYKLAAHKLLFAKRNEEYIERVSTRREGIERLATSHPGILLNYNIYLRGILDELAKCNLDEELKQVEAMLKQRNIKKESTLSSSPPRSIDTMTTRGQEATMKEQELPAVLADAWDKLGIVGELKARLALLKTMFEFVEEAEYATHEFAREYRSNEAMKFLARFNDFIVESSSRSSDSQSYGTGANCRRSLKRLLSPLERSKN